MQELKSVFEKLKNTTDLYFLTFENNAFKGSSCAPVARLRGWTLARILYPGVQRLARPLKIEILLFYLTLLNIQIS